MLSKSKVAGQKTTVEEWVESFSDGILFISPLDGSNSWRPRERDGKRESGLAISRLLPQGPPHCSVSAPPRKAQTRRVSPPSKAASSALFWRGHFGHFDLSDFHRYPTSSTPFSRPPQPEHAPPAPHPHPAPRPEPASVLFLDSLAWRHLSPGIDRVRVHTSAPRGPETPTGARRCAGAASQTRSRLPKRGEANAPSGPCRTRTGAPTSTTSPPRRPVASSIPTARCDMVSGRSRLSGDMLLLHLTLSVRLSLCLFDPSRLVCPSVSTPPKTPHLRGPWSASPMSLYPAPRIVPGARQTDRQTAVSPWPVCRSR